MAFGKVGGDFVTELLALGEEFFEVRSVGVGEEAVEVGEEFVGDGGGAFQRMGEGVEAFRIPTGEDFVAGAAEVRDVDVDRFGLADAIESSDPLFQKLRVGGEIEEDEVVGELEVSAFAADLGTDEEAGAVCFGEPGGIAVSLEEAEVFVEEGDVEIDGVAQGSIDLHDALERVADQDDLLVCFFSEKREEPNDERGEFVVGVWGGDGG